MRALGALAGAPLAAVTSNTNGNRPRHSTARAATPSRWRSLDDHGTVSLLERRGTTVGMLLGAPAADADHLLAPLMTAASRARPPRGHPAQRTRASSVARRQAPEISGGEAKPTERTFDAARRFAGRRNRDALRKQRSTKVSVAFRRRGRSRGATRLWSTDTEGGRAGLGRAREGLKITGGNVRLKKYEVRVSERPRAPARDGWRWPRRGTRRRTASA